MVFSKLSSLDESDASDANSYRDQPRVPAGQSHGGRWTRLDALLGAKAEPGDGRLEGAPSTPSSKLPDDVPRLAFDRGDYNTIPQFPRRIVKSAPMRADQALDLFDNVSALNGPDGQAVLELERKPKLNAFAFLRTAPDDFAFTHATLTRPMPEEVKKRCNKFGEVQRLLNETYAKVLKNNPGLDRAGLGMKLHSEMKVAINNLGERGVRGVHLYAERSFVKGKPEPPDDRTDYGVPGSRRPDAVEKSYGAAVQQLSPDTVCIYEHSIGKRNLGASRVFSLGEVIKHAFASDNNIQRIIITQMRPSNWRP